MKRLFRNILLGFAIWTHLQLPNAGILSIQEKARTMNAKLAELLRFSLEGYESKFVTLNQELKFIRNYLDIEKIRFGRKPSIN
ncbi:MAG: histidine kinase, partial [Bacteroidetes bacterium]|nr:histidine kinase [Bacteroidota bacterium]